MNDSWNHGNKEKRTEGATLGEAAGRVNPDRINSR